MQMGPHVTLFTHYLQEDTRLECSITHCTTENICHPADHVTNYMYCGNLTVSYCKERPAAVAHYSVRFVL